MVVSGISNNFLENPVLLPVLILYLYFIFSVFKQMHLYMK